MVSLGPGDLILLAAAASALLSIVLSIKNVNRSRWPIRAFVLLLSADFALLLYYFLSTDLTINYVWTFTSRDLPTIYKITGALGGQQGTLLYWAFLISLGSLWISEKNDSLNDFIKKTQIILLSIGVSFIGLTLVDSPFLTIYELYPDISRSFIPQDGAGLNPLLINPWMAVHPPIMFMGYAMMAVSFSLATAYLLSSVYPSRFQDAHRIWIRNVVPWTRISWLLLFLGIAIGGIWSYEVLGWGGFWAWDPVETSSLIPWFLLTGALHSLVEHRAGERKFPFLTPALVAMSFVLVLYATFVTRSGFFESIHSFATSTVGGYLLLIILITAISTIGLAIYGYLRSKQIEKQDDSPPLINRTSVFYFAILLFLILASVSFWGITFPAINSFAAGTKMSMSRDFFDLWNGPFIIALMLLVGFGLNYKHSVKTNQLRLLLVFTTLTVIAAFIKPSEGWTYLRYAGTIGPERSFLYNVIGSASILSILPPLIYISYGATGRIWERIKPARKTRYRMKEIGVIIVHIGIVFVVVGWAFSANFTTQFSAVGQYDKDETLRISNAPYAVKLLKVYVRQDVDKMGPRISGFSVTGFYLKLLDDINSGSVKNSYTVHGVVQEVVDAGAHLSYVRLVEGQRELWAVTERTAVPKYSVMMVTGYPIFGFRSLSLGKTFDVILFSVKEDSVDLRSATRIVRVTEQVTLAIYEGRDNIGEGTAEKVQYEQGVAYQPMIYRGLLKDTYVIFRGIDGESIPLTVKIIPMMSTLWIGVALLATGMALVFFFDSRYKAKKAQELTL